MLLALFLVLLLAGVAYGFSVTPMLPPRVLSTPRTQPRLNMAFSLFQEQTTFQPVFDFTTAATKNETKCAVDAFERIDDAIMGGISTSTVRDVPNKPYASWSGVCRLDGGGFCGMRTFPFVEPLVAENVTGLYLDCRLTSDDEPQRRVWKMTTRTESSGRGGEEVYQASFDVPKNKQSWARIKVPFEDFVKVRGPRLIQGAPPLNVTGGLYQIGLSLSKFVIGPNITELENFRPGYFELQLQRIGFYYNQGSTITTSSGNMPDTLDASIANQDGPVLFRLLLPLFRKLFSEQKRRRRSAMKLLREERNMTRWDAMWLGIRRRKNSGNGWVPSVATTLKIVLNDSVSSVAGILVRYGLFYPLIYSTRIIRVVKKKLSSTKEDAAKEGGTG